jgi:hypothetical protein
MDNDNGIPMGCRCFCLCYAPAVAAPIGRKIARWIFDQLLWDTAGAAPQGFRRGVWATRKLLIALAGSEALDWMEWVEHHPPEMAIIVVIHFVFVLAAIALCVYVWQSVSRRKSLSG